MRRPTGVACSFHSSRSGCRAAALAGLVGPWLYLRLGWQSTVVSVGALMMLSALALQPMVRRFDNDLDRSARTGGLSVVAPLQAVLNSAPLRRLAWVSVFYAMTQLCLLTFLVSYLHLSHGLSLSASAAVLATAQLASMAGRPFWGHMADLWGNPARLLGLMGLGMGASCWALAALPAQPSLWWVYLVCIACAATAVAWNGVFYAELVRAAPQDQLATVTGGTQFLTFLGAMIGPVLFSQVVSWRGGDYGFAFALVAVLPVLAGASMLLAEARSGPQPAPG
ncbi:MAG: MFS transporter [Burkholderiaceae bacterium]